MYKRLKITTCILIVLTTVNPIAVFAGKTDLPIVFAYGHTESVKTVIQ